MTGPVLHHVTALAGAVDRHLRFYREQLGMALLARTVNRDDPGVCHLIYGPLQGPWLTFLLMPRAHRASPGFGSVECVSLPVAEGSLAEWEGRLKRRVVGRDSKGLLVRDPDHLTLRLVESSGHPGGGVGAPLGVTLTVKEPAATETFLAELLERPSQLVEVRQSDSLQPAQPGCGGVHHLAFCSDLLPDHCVVQQGHFFRSAYLREPGGVLLELATPPRGLVADGGRSLQLPSDLEPRRAEIELALPKLELKL